MRPDLIRSWGEVLDALAWERSAEQLAKVRETLPAVLAALDVGLGPVLAGMSDEALVLCVQKDFLTTETFEELFVRRYSVYLSRWLFRWRVPAERAQDLIQQVYLKCWEKRLASYRPGDGSNFRAYLRQAIHNLWVERECRPRKTVLLTEEMAPPAESADPSAGLVGREEAERVEAALRRLPRPERQVLVATIKGQTAGEISATLGLPKPRVFQLLFRARRRMERYLQLPSQKVPRRARRSAPHGAPIPKSQGDQE